MTNNHPWCSNLARDTAIRAAEDAAASERPPVPDHRDLPERVARLEAAVFGVTESRSADARTDETSQGGLRTERVTLEVTQTAEDFVPLSEWGWHGLRHWGASSVRVVPSSEAAIPDVSDQDGDRVAIDWPGLAKVLQSERDAAIRERDAALARVAAAEARAAELEAALKILDDGQPTAPSDLGIWGTANELSARCQELAARLVAASTRATAAEARVAELEKQQADAEPVAWRVTADDPPPAGQMVLGRWDLLICGNRTVSYGEVVNTSPFPNVWWCAASRSERIPPTQWRPLPPGPKEDRASWEVKPAADRAPPPPRGWLLPEERLALDAARTILDQGGRTNVGVTIDAILSRNSPPRVRLPECPYESYDDGWNPWFAAIEAMQKALAAAGVEVGE